MDVVKFYQLIKEAFQDFNDRTVVESKTNQTFLNILDEIVLKEEIDPSLRMTSASILFEGYYQHLDHSSSFKQVLSEIKAQRWQQHFGSPTLTFLLSYKKKIDQTKQYFEQLQEEKSEFIAPWFIGKEQETVLDRENNVFVDPKSISRVETPKNRETTGFFTKTYNPFGGFTTTACDPFSQEFIHHAERSAKNGGQVLEIGAAFGSATLEAIAKEATVYCNDIRPENLAVVRNRFLEESNEKQTESITGDTNQLVLIPGELPHELIGLPESFFDAILICRVLHFFTGTKINESLALLGKLLSPGGKIYIVCETPYLKNWQKFIPEFHKRIEKGMEWPGEITNPSEYESSGRSSSLPKFVHWITKEVLERSLEKAGFKIERAEYINRLGQFPEDLLLPEYGKESVGAIGLK
ncbi:class I SAM-dependent methyltransferase [Legionella israelensis]|uniref:Putative Methyltransferase n=1 Tax=Legionella israelensis TaxID=454 RepID=A0A0W0WKC0_9GAMM|nr:class I SAM-dependent methyltransferase [Legionella israelensis]KTD32707.1 putative Methyltransferase [Legionella israelensis]QBS08989.1 class I SAM-dependent methyltransferase [Legionella israelensis]SCY35762.1 Ubiquinone/menaquinone biosynthesis C-methylase UbiE [Legionella israelensis DSM 19235]STX58685.1 putative Methyltransferase [Legionella israelensis]